MTVSIAHVLWVSKCQMSYTWLSTSGISYLPNIVTYIYKHSYLSNIETKHYPTHFYANVIFVGVHNMNGSERFFSVKA